MRSIKELAWVAGLLEGEGSFGWGRTTPTIQLSSTDKDVVIKAADILGVQMWNYVARPKGKSTYKPVYACKVFGSRAVMWMMTLFVLMGKRRRGKIKEVITKWRESPGFPRAPRGQRWMAICHPDKPRDANGLCNTCYMRQWRAKRKSLTLA